MSKIFVFLGLFLYIMLQPCFPQEAIELEKIVVTPSRIEQREGDLSQNVSVITSDDIEEGAIFGLDEALDMLPSVDVWEQGSLGATKSLHIRGVTSEQVLVLVDGRPLNTPRDAFADLNEISLGNVERIEVLRGPASSMYGSNAVGGVVNVITKRGTDESGTTLTTKFGSFATKNVMFSHGNKLKNFDYFISYDYISSHGHRDNSDYLAHTLDAKLGYELSEEHDVTFSTGYYDSQAGTPATVDSQDLD
ncbi:MAG: TonB-dependent receptor, partial [Candidatus Omnitrophota bacterium]